MIDTGVGERLGRVGNEARPVFDALVGKLRIPSTRPRSVRRTSLIDRLVREVSRPIVSVVAPAGYGKTTLLVQWAERSGQAVAWVSVDEQDNDSKGLLGAVARALDAVRPVARPVFDALASPASSVPCSVMPRLGNAFAAMTVPVPVILDDMHVLHSSECRAWPRSSESSASPAAARWHGACGRQGSIRQRDRRYLGPAHDPTSVTLSADQAAHRLIVRPPRPHRAGHVTSPPGDVSPR
jgi:hypothetical protein